MSSLAPQIPPPVLLCTGGYDHTIKFWDLLTGNCTATIQHLPSHINCMRLSPNKRLLAIGSVSQVKVFDARSVWMFESNANTVVPSPQQSYQQQQPLPTSPVDPLSNLSPLWILDAPLTSNVIFIEFIRLVDNCYHLWVISEDGSLKEWHLPLPLDCLTTSTTFTSISIPSRPSSPTIAQHPSLNASVEDLSQKEEYMAKSTMSVNLLSQKPLRTPERIIVTPAGQTFPAPLLSSFSILNRRIFLTGDSWGRIRLYKDSCCIQQLSLTSFKTIQSITTQNDIILALTEEEVFIFRLCDGGGDEYLVEKVIKHAIPLKSGGIRVMFCPIPLNDDKKVFTIGTQEGQVLIYHLNNNLEIELVHRLKGHQRWVWDMGFSADGAYLFTASSDRTARLWDVSHWTRGSEENEGSGKCIVQYKGHMKALTSLALNDHPS